MDGALDMREMLEYINPGDLDYSKWVEVGMALKHEGFGVDVWDEWSKRDPGRYSPGGCEKKWETFRGTSSPVTGATIVQMAKEGGWVPAGEGHELAWDDEIAFDPNWIEDREIPEPVKWDPAREAIRYLETLFEAGENVGYVMESYTNDKGKHIPRNKGAWDRTAGQLIQALESCKGDIGSVFGDYDKQAGAWVRFNPLDGQGVRNENVTEFRYALVESDELALERQYAIIKDLELPVAILMYSGGKSLHAIVRIDAADYNEYRRRVDYLYSICQKNGMKIDTQNRNPSRLSRLPGCIRGDKKQYIIDTNIGKANFTEWKDWIESINDDLPDIEELETTWNSLPELAHPLIDGVLRQGHKMLVAGPSKAGKSFALIELVIAIAEGKKWMGWQCSQGRVMYVNLELDRASCLHRFRDVYEAHGIPARNLANIDIWNLRGKSVPMDKLAPKLIRRAQKKGYLAIVIDPIYKIITGDENSADQMAKFCNQFDLVCTELECAVIYCHHHSKGSQANKKSMDRSSGSGVFARDPDAVLDMIELEVTEELQQQEGNKESCRKVLAYLEEKYPLFAAELSQDDRLSFAAIRREIEGTDMLTGRQIKELLPCIDRLSSEAEKEVESYTAWRIEGTLREFPKFPPVNCWFKYPVHTLDESGALQDITPAEEGTPWNKTWKQNFRKSGKRAKSKDELKAERKEALENAFDSLSTFYEDGRVSLDELAENMGLSLKSVRRRVEEHDGFYVKDKYVGKIN